MWRSIVLAAVVCTGLPLVAERASAQVPLACSAQSVGMQICQTGTICKCAFEPGGTMTQQPRGYMWNCDIANGACPANTAQIPLSNTMMGQVQVSPGGRRTVDNRAVQDALRAAGFDPGATDGVIGSRTRNAIREWQRSQGANATGRLTDEETRRLGL
ncbi:peptidoglycan-binding protein [Lacibacterium aquatile]|uniref:Peptidoglycan-binding protein n=1 Tax=Lacibacterium aquatile TaxID=1168082 RepID=A0ABW5DPY4_9PROT